MKRIFILFAIAISMIACSSGSKHDTNVYHKTERTDDVYRVPVIHMSEENNTVNLRVVVIDSCEYLVGNTSSGYAGYGYLTHKGNCKYCAERRKRELENLK